MSCTLGGRVVNISQGFYSSCILVCVDNNGEFWALGILDRAAVFSLECIVFIVFNGRTLGFAVPNSFTFRCGFSTAPMNYGLIQNIDTPFRCSAIKLPATTSIAAQGVEDSIH